MNQHGKMSQFMPVTEAEARFCFDAKNGGIELDNISMMRYIGSSFIQ